MFEGGSLTCRFAIGTTAGSEQKEKEAVTVENVRRIALEVFPNQASFTGIGAYEGKEEDFVEVHVTEIVRPEGITNCVQFCEKANILLSRVLSELHQDSVLVDVEVLPNDQERRPLKWKTLANANRPAVFPRPTAIARYMIPSAVYRSLKQVYAVARNTYVDEWPGVGNTVEGVPVVWFPFSSTVPLVFEGAEASESLTVRLRIWDAQFVQGEQHVLERTDPWAEELGEFLSRFQRMSDYPCFFVANLPSFVRREATKLELGKCKYVLGAVHCEARYLEAVDYSFSTARRGLGETHHYWRERSRHVPCAAFPILGITVVTVSPKNEVLVKKRTKTVGAYPEAFHVAPGAIVEET